MVGFVMAIVLFVTTFAATTVVTASGATTSEDQASTTTGAKTAAVSDEEETKPTINKEPGIYPIDADHYLIVHEDGTYEIRHGEDHIAKPWTIA